MESTRNNRLTALSEARIEYMPTPADIAHHCASIRRGWSPRERRRRRVGSGLGKESGDAWFPPVIDTSQLMVRGLKSENS